jgi:hypothetical protein
MKQVMLALCVVASAQAFATTQIIEFDQAKEVKCYAEVKKLGCVAKNGEENSDCVESKKAKLTSECKSIHETKRQNK